MLAIPLSSLLFCSARRLACEPGRNGLSNLVVFLPEASVAEAQPRGVDWRAALPLKIGHE
jgi:hypothetical protein